MGRRILIVDDSAISRKMLKSCIPNDRGYEFFEGADGAEGIQKFTEEKPDITFMDLTMPVMDGTEALKAIMTLDPKALVIVSTADIQVKSLERVEALGAFLVLKKPPTKENVRAALDKAEIALVSKDVD